MTPKTKAIGRAFTVKGPDIYLNALESIPSGSIYVHGEARDDCAVWGGLYAERYGKSRGLIAAVIDGGTHGRTETVECSMPTFARFVSPLAATNREKGIIHEPVKCGGVPVHPDDIVIGDEDGVVVIPGRHEQEIFDKLDAFLAGLALFGKIAQQPGVIVGTPMGRPSSSRAKVFTHSLLIAYSKPALKLKRIARAGPNSKKRGRPVSRPSFVSEQIMSCFWG